MIAMRRKLLLLSIIWQITLSGLVSASTSSGASVEYIPVSKNLGIGTVTPLTKLDVNGQIMIRGGSPGTSKVLISDANGKGTWASTSSLLANVTTLDTLDSLQFLRSDTTDNFSSGVLITDSGTRFDVNGDLSIADTNISLDGANTTFTQSTGNISLVPASAKDLSSTISSGGEFKINTSDLVFNGTNARVGIGTSNPSTKLDVNGTIKGLTINGTSANFTNITTGSLTNTGTSNFTKLIVTNNVNGATGNFTTGNFTNAVISGIINGSTSSFDGDFTDGSVFFSNNNGVISQDNSHFYWDQSNKRLAINHASPDMAIDINGGVAFRNIDDGVITSPGSPVVFESATAPFYSNGWSMTANKPAGTVDGDLLIAYHYSQRPTDTHNTPAGWTLLTFNRRKSVNPFVVVGVNLSVYYKIASGEPSSYTFTGNVDDLRRMVGIARYSGHDPSNPIDVSTTTNGDSIFSSPNSTVQMPSVTTTVANAKIVKIAALTGEDFFGLKLYDQYPSGYSLRVNMNYHSLYDKDQAGAGLSDNGNVTYPANTSSGYVTAVLAIAPSPGSSSSVLPNPDNGSMFLYLSNGASATANPGDLFAKIKESGVTKTIKIIDFNNGSLATSNNSETVDGLDSSVFLRSDSSDNFTTGTLAFDAGTTLAMDAGSTFDINSTNVSIADTDISLDGSNTTLTQSSGNISLVPASGKDISTTIASGGEFKINTSDFIFNGTNARVGIGTANPSTKLDVNGTIKGSVINGSSANFSGTSNVAKLISSGAVNGTTANFPNALFGSTINTGKLISSGVVNGTTANFSTVNFTNLNLTTSTITTLNSTTINNSGTISTAKLISSGEVNGATANFNKVIASGSVNGTNANFTNIIASGIFNGSTSSFDGDFTNGSILFSNADGVISQNNSQLYWDRTNNKLALGMNLPNEKVTINGALAIKEGSAPSADSGFAKLYVNPANSKLYFQNDSGISYNLTNGSIAAVVNPGGLDTQFQFNNGGYLSGNGALTFIKASKTLQIPADAPLDINSTSVSIADSDISLDSASGVTFTPSSGQNLNIALSTSGDFTVNSNQLYLDTSAAKLGLLINNPNEVLTVNGSISIKEASAASGTSDFGKLYVKTSDSKLYFKNDSGTEYGISSPSSTSSINSLSDAISNMTDAVYLGANSGTHATGVGRNTAVGINSLNGNTTGAENVAVGFEALFNNINGTANSAFGNRSLYSNTGGLSTHGGHNNTAAGNYSLFYSTLGYSNTAIGVNTLLYNTIANYNTAFGASALAFNTDGEYNTAVGSEAQYYNTSGDGNTALGVQALHRNHLGDHNTAIGYRALMGTNNGSYNTAFGTSANIGLRHGDYNTALGFAAISSMSNGSYNIAVGSGAGTRPGINFANLYTSNGLSIGYRAAYYDFGDNNIMIGYNAGNGTTTGSNNLLIGYNNNNLPSSVSSNQLDIGDTLYGDIANHNIGIGTTSIDTKLEVNGLAMTNLFVSKAFYSNTSATNVTIDWNNSNEQKITLAHNVTFAFTAPTNGVGTLSLMLTQDGTGSRTATWPASVKWPGGTAPTLSTAAGYVDVISCVYEASTYLCQIGFDFR